jgi:RecJ-like exonuclease
MVFEEQPELVNLAQETADQLETVDEPIRVVAHYDCDGISSAVIAHEALDRADIPFDITFVEELDEQMIRELKATKDENVFFFIDIGSGQTDSIADILDEKTVLIADHHEPGEADVDSHVNPHLVGIDGGEAISGAGVTYLIARLMDEQNEDLLPYALVGATGDIQTEGETYLGLNAELVETAGENDLIERKKGLRLYGRSTKSIVDALQYTTDPYLPGISNNPSGAVQLLSDAGIDMRENGDWRCLEDLSLEEEKQIVHELLTRGYDVSGLIGDVYILENGWEIGEFASLMNACGRLERPEDGITICLEEDYDLASTVKKAYGRKIGKYLSFVEDNQDDSEVIQEFDKGAIIVADEKIHANMIGTITTICQKSDIISGNILVGIAEKGEDHYKISARATDGIISDELTMNRLMEHICDQCGGDGGGHEAAAGGKIPQTAADRFIKLTGDVLREGSLDPIQD